MGLFKSEPPKILIHYSVIGICNEKAQTCVGALETGGILLGSLRGPHIEIISLTTPGPKDESRTFEFVRKDIKHEKSALEAWKNSSGVISFFGEWHTHPFGSPIPSGIDKNSWRSLVRRFKVPMTFIIIAPGNWCPFLAFPRSISPKIVQLQKIEDGKEGQVFSAVA